MEDGCGIVILLRVIIYIKDLTPKKYILDEIKILKKILKKNYTSIHVRRTDHNLSRDGKNVFVKDSVFFDFLE